MSHLADKLASMTPAARRLLEAKLRQKGIAIDRFQISPRSGERDHYPLSFSQQRLWFLHQMEPTSSAYHIESPFRIEGPCAPRILRRALSLLVARHEALRTAFQTVDDMPVQRVLPPFEQWLPVVDLTALAPEVRRRVGRRLTRCHVVQPFDLTAGRPLRSALVRHGARDHTVLLTMHHIVSDGWSLGVLYRELVSGYAALVAGRTPHFAPLPIQYPDYAIWQREWQEREIFPGQLEHWKRQLAGLPALLDLPTDRPRPALQSVEGGHVAVRQRPDLLHLLRSLARREKTTLFVVLLSGYYAVLHRWTGVSDLAVGSPVAGRNRQELEPLIGFFVNTLVLRADLSGTPTFRQLLQRIREVNGEANANQDLPFEMLVDELHVERSLQHNPLFQVSFSFQSDPGLEAAGEGGASSGLGGVKILPQQGEYSATMFDLSLWFTETPQHLTGSLVYNLDLFDRTTVHRLSRRLVDFLVSALADPDASIDQLSLLGAVERHQVVREWNSTATLYPEDRLLHQWFEWQAAHSPQRTALEFAGQTLSYGELNRRANRLARHLLALGVEREELVAVALERSFEMVVALLAILKAGAAYLPIDPSYPRRRLEFMLGDARVRVLLTQGSVSEELPESGARQVLLAEGGAQDHLAGLDDSNLGLTIPLQALAYMIYTSGSTGQPKGAMNSHDAILNRILWMQERYRLDDSDAVLQKTPFSFDVSVWEFFWPLAVGARLVIAEPGGHQESRYLARLIAEAQVTTLHFVPSMLRTFLDEFSLDEPDLAACHGVRRVICSGEALPSDLARRFAERLPGELHNLYGPTEAAVDVTSWQCIAGPAGAAAAPAETATVPIGRPIANSQIYLLDGAGSPVALGVAGELMIGGTGLARGYWRRPGLTAEKFVPDPFGPAGARLYRTGDLVRHRHGGQMEFLSRIDHQVKIRGLRIELGEIEAALLAGAEIREATVLAREFSAGDQRLCAYLVAAEGREIPPASELRDSLSATLPEYMVPSTFLTLDSLPLSPNGKVDRKVLMAMEMVAPESEGEYVAPRTPIEEVLAEIWSEVLGREPIGVRDNFFDLGGHSLLATQVVSRVRRSLSAELAVRSLFLKPTIQELAPEVELARRRAEGEEVIPPIVPRAEAEDYPLSFAQERLWFICQMVAESSLYNLPTLLRMEGELLVAALARSTGEIARRHEVLRSVVETVDGVPRQRILPASSRLPLIDLSGLAERSPEIRAAVSQRLIAIAADFPFDLARGPLYLNLLLRLSRAEHIALFVLHHLISDGWSKGILTRELATLYAAYRDDPQAATASPLAPLPVQYADYATWQRGWLRGERLEREVDYWRQRLEGIEPLLALPLDRPRPAVATWAGGGVGLHLPPRLINQLRAYGRDRGLTLFMMLLAFFEALLYRYCGQSEFCLGSPIAGRNQAEIEGLIGFFVNTLVLPARISPQTSFDSLSNAVRDVTLAAHDHQDLPFETLVRELQIERSMSHAPLYQVMFSLQNAPGCALELPGLRLSAVTTLNTTARFDLALNLIESGESVVGSIGYKSDLFDATTMRRLSRHFASLMSAALARPEVAIDRLDLLEASERHQLLTEYNDPRPDYAVAEWPAERFMAIAGHQPDAIAVVFDDPRGVESRISYGYLARQVDRVAAHLQGLGVGPEVVVGVSIPRSAPMVVALLAVLRAGGAYLPLDTEYPVDRLRFMMEDAQPESAPRIVVVSETTRDLLSETGAMLLTVEQTLAAGPLEAESASLKPVALYGDHPAYVIYTSGSTGRPKGVVIPHRALANRLEFTRVADAGSAYRYLHKTTIGFDVSICEIFQPLAAAAGTVVVAKPDGQWDLAYLLSLIQRQRVTHASFAPSVHTVLIDRPELADCTSLEVLYTAGEAVSAELSQHLASLLESTGGAFENRYGPTEATVGALAYRFAPHRREAVVPIGWPIARAAVYVVDRGLRPLARGATGELAIGGDCLARGYLGRPALTAAAFVPDPFATAPGARLYRTGDLGRRRGDGAIEFLGRVDHQVKVRGFRIELGEVESALNQHPALAAAVVVRCEGSGGPQLVAYYVVAGEEAGVARVAEGDLKSFLSESLPDYMVPAVFVELEAMPTTSFGKIDRRSLPEPKKEVASRGAKRLPRDEVEERLSQIWCELLEADEVDISENFFDLGGHSLLLVRLQSRLRDEFGFEPSMVDLFRLPTVAAQAEFLRRQAGAEPVAAAAIAGSSRARRLAADSTQGSRDVAIVGMACRYPGAPDLETFWRNLRDGVESISFYTPEQLREMGVSDAVAQDPRFVPAQAFLDGADLFDADPFGLTPREAQLLDPQQRIFLETAWTALEHAGYDPSAFDGEIGVYAGASLSRYWLNLFTNPEILASVGEMPILLSNDKDFLPTRVSYLLDLKGPSVSINSACSTSLVAAHMACRNLINGECDMALAGGVTVAGRDRHGYFYEEGGIQSYDGHNSSYDAGARGTATSAGAGVVVLKRLADALAERDTIWGVIRGSAINNDGSEKIGFTAPSITGQARVIAEAQAAAGVEAKEIGMIEGHGSATPLGDPIEVAALTEVFAAQGPLPPASVALGSVKSNIGHTGSAAGVAGLIKTALCVAHRELPPSANFRVPNPQIDFAAGPFFVNTELRRWQRSDPMRAGVSAFGLGGTNAHMVVEEPPEQPAAADSRSWQLLPLSAATEPALESMTDQLADFLRDSPEPLADAAFTLQAGRRRLAYRRFLVCKSGDEAARALAERDPRRLLGGKGGKADRSVAFLLPGLGDHYPGMACGLYAAEPTFRAAVDRCCELLAPLLGVDLRQLLFAVVQEMEEPAEATEGTENTEAVDLRSLLGRGTKAKERGNDPVAQKLHRTRLAQPAVFVVEFALAQLWSEWGVKPEALLGYSLGEYTAACLAGVFSLGDALKVVAERARLIDALPAGAMVAVPLTEGELVALIAELELPAEDGLSIAATQGPSITVASGSAQAVAKLEARLGEEGLASRRLPTTHAFHSAMMRRIGEPFTAVLASVELHAPRIPFVSNVTGEWIEDEEAIDPAYWVRHLCGTVRFTEGLSTLLAGDRLLLEVGPGQALGTSARQHPNHDSGRHTVIASLRDERERADDLAFALGALGRAWSAGAAIDWPGFAAHETRHRIPLPTYPFDRRSYWVEPQPLAAPRPRQGKLPRIDEWFYVPAWKRVLAAVPDRPAVEEPVNWLIFCARDGIGSAAADRLEQGGYRVSRVHPGGGYEDCGDGRFQVEPTQAQDYADLFATLKAQGREPEAIAHFWGAEVEEPSAGEPHRRDREAYEVIQPLSLYSLLALVAGIVRSGFVAPAALSLFSRGARQVEPGDRVNPEQELALAALRVIPQEFRSLRCRCVDLPARLPEVGSRFHQRLSAAVEAELSLAAVEHTASSELCVALRASGRWQRQFEAVEIPPQAEDRLPLRRRGVYLLTGGLGRLGLAVAEMLASRYEARLVLTARTALPPRDQWQPWMAAHDRSEATAARMRRILAMEVNGAQVLTLAVDAADAEAMSEAVSTVERRFGRLDGVVHLAGSLGDGVSVPAEKTTIADCEHHRPSKVEGLWALERALARRQVDFCLLFSSLSTVLGGLGFTAYSAANGYMDAFAHRHNAEFPDQPWISVDWDGWEYLDPTLAAEEQPVSNLGGLVMSAEESVEALRRALSLFAVPQVVVSTGDLQGRLDTWYPQAEEMEAEEGEGGAAGSTGSSAGPRPELANPFVAPSDEVEEEIARIWRGLLGIAPVGIHDHYFELGGDSLLATQMISRLRTAFRIQLGLADLFASPTVAGIAELIRGGGEKPLDELEALLGDIESLDESEAAQRLEESALSSAGAEEER